MPNLQVSVVLPFLNSIRFFKETIESVLTQTYSNWELLLVDDGSTDGSEKLAIMYENKYPEKVRYLYHDSHQNRGTSASRNLGSEHAQGEMIAYLDHDDVWLPEKLERQTAILESHPEVDAIFGATRYWASWTGNPRDHLRDCILEPWKYYGIESDSIINPPRLLHPLIEYDIMPFPSSLLVRHNVVDLLGGWENEISVFYEDGAFYTKLFHKSRIYVSSECLEKYRVHDDSTSHILIGQGRLHEGRKLFLDWAERYLKKERFSDDRTMHFLKNTLFPRRNPLMSRVYPIVYRFIVQPFYKSTAHLLSQNESTHNCQTTFPKETQPSDFEGELDRIDSEIIGGWAWNKNLPTMPIFVDVYCDDLLLTTINADHYRGSLLDSNKGNGFHGFDFLVPFQLRNGKWHTLKMKVSGLNAPLPEYQNKYKWPLGLCTELEMIAERMKKRYSRGLVASVISLISRLKWSLTHNKELFLIRDSGFFNREWYYERNPDLFFANVDPLVHYLRYGGFEGRDPGPGFSSAWYLEMYEDVKNSKINPLIHYLKYGKFEGRRPKKNDQEIDHPNNLTDHQKQERINLEEVVFDPASMGDPQGKLFFYENEIYRGIYYSSSKFFLDLFTQGITKKLFNLGVIETEISSMSIEGYSLILKHRTIPFRNYPYEWCDEMLKDAALLTCNLNRSLATFNLTTQDAHCWNLMYDGTKIKFVDFTSIIPIETDVDWRLRRKKWIEQFRTFFLFPLLLFADGYYQSARQQLMCEINNAKDVIIPKEEINKLLQTARQFDHRMGNLINNPFIVKSDVDFFDQLFKSVETIRFPELNKTKSSHFNKVFLSREFSQSWTTKHHVVHKILSRLRPVSVIDLGCNMGWYSTLAASMGSEVIAIDNDEACIRDLYLYSSCNNLPIYPLLMDIKNPSPAIKRTDGVIAYTPAVDRLKCDMALALSIAHILVFEQGLGFEEIVELFSDFTNKWLLVEFVPPTDRHVYEWYSDEYNWYSLEGFVTELYKYFSHIEILDSYPKPRKLLLCTR